MILLYPEAIKEFKKNIKGHGNLKTHYFGLINSWLQSDSHPPNSCKKVKGAELYELKKTGTQARLLGYYEGSDFFVLKCIQKKDDKLKSEDIQTSKNRKRSFDKESITWEEAQ